MPLHRSFSYLLGTFIIGALAIGRFYDPRLIYGPLNLAFVIMIFYGIGLYFVFRGSRFKLPKGIENFSGLVLIFIFYQSILLLKYGYNVTQYYSFHKVINLIFLAIIPGILFSSDYGNRIFQYGLAGFTSLFFVIGMCYLLMGITGDRMAVLGGGPIVFARWISVFVLVVIASKMKLILKIVFSALGLLLVLAAGSKGPFIALILAAGYYFIKGSSKKSLVIGLGIIFITVFSLLGSKFQESTRVMNGLNDPRSLTSVVSRLEKLNVALRLIEDNVWGIGLGNYPKYGKEINAKYILEVDYPHNIFAEMAVESGLPWLLILLTGMILSWKRGVKNCEGSFMPSLFLLLLVNTQFSGDLSNSKFLVIVLIVLCFYGKSQTSNLV
jgi:hypothetical protein